MARLFTSFSKRGIPYTRMDKRLNSPSLTPSQEQILRFIKERCEQAGGTPSYREIQEHFGYRAVGTVQDHVQALIKKGKLERLSAKGRRARSLVPVGASHEGIKRISIFGEIAAGEARDAEQVELGSLVILEGLAQDPCFALRVVGDSMIEAGIFEGDHLIVERGARIASGDIVVALLNGETTVKRYSVQRGKTFLLPANRRLKPIPVHGERFEIQGKVVGLQRKL
jgi:repressor LexA